MRGKSPFVHLEELGHIVTFGYAVVTAPEQLQKKMA
jgi:hypothetical protein